MHERPNDERRPVIMRSLPAVAKRLDHVECRRWLLPAVGEPVADGGRGKDVVRKFVGRQNDNCAPVQTDPFQLNSACGSRTRQTSADDVRRPFVTLEYRRPHAVGDRERATISDTADYGVASIAYA